MNKGGLPDPSTLPSASSKLPDPSSLPPAAIVKLPEPAVVKKVEEPKNDTAPVKKEEVKKDTVPVEVIKPEPKKEEVKKIDAAPIKTDPVPAKIEEVKKAEPIPAAKVEDIKKVETIPAAKVEEINKPDPIPASKVEEVKKVTTPPSTADTVQKLPETKSMLPDPTSIPSTSSKLPDLSSIPAATSKQPDPKSIPVATQQEIKVPEKAKVDVPTKDVAKVPEVKPATQVPAEVKPVVATEVKTVPVTAPEVKTASVAGPDAKPAPKEETKVPVGKEESKVISPLTEAKSQIDKQDKKPADVSSATSPLIEAPVKAPASSDQTVPAKAPIQPPKVLDAPASEPIAPKALDAPVSKSVKFQDPVSPSKAAPGPGSSQAIQKSKKIQPGLATDKLDYSGPDLPNKYSLTISEQAKRLQQWHQNMRLFKLFNADRLPAPKHSETRIYGVQVGNLSPVFTMPQVYNNETKYAVTIQVHYTLCDPSVGLYGRTAIQKHLGNPMSPKDIVLDYMILFHSDLDLSNTYLLSEVVINIHDKQTNEILNNIALGILPIKILKEDGEPTAKLDQEIYLTTPRAFVIFSGKDTIESKLKSIKKNEKNYKMTVEVQQLNTPKQAQLLKFLMPNCVVGAQDVVPGLDEVPKSMSLDSIDFNKIQTVWGHNLKVENIDKVDGLFLKFLKVSVGTSGYKASIVQRKITCTPSNSTSLFMASQTFIDLKVNGTKIETPTELLKIQNLAANRLTCLVFRVSYKIKYMSQGNPDISREFVLGRAPFFLNFDSSGLIKDRLVKFDLSMCPELGIVNDLLWDVNESNAQASDLVIKLSLTLSNSDDLKSDQEQQAFMEQYVQKEVEKQLKAAAIMGNTNVSVDESTIQKMAQMEIALKQQQNQLMKMEEQKKVDIQKAQKDATMQAKVTLQEDSKKEGTKPIEIPAVSKDPQSRMIDAFLNREDKDVQKMIELLQKLLTQTQGNQDLQKDVISRLQNSILRMLETDPSSQMTMFGTTGRYKALQFNNLPEQDKLQILNDSARTTKSLNSGQLDLNMVTYKPKLEIELKDQFKASTISIKIVAFKTPNMLNRSISMPNRVFFTTKFFTFRKTTTDQVILRLPKSVAKDLQHQQTMQKASAQSSQAKTQGQLLEGKQYFLMTYDASKTLTKQIKPQSTIDTEYEGMISNGLEVNFDFDPSVMTDISEDSLHESFSKYLLERVLTIDIWNGDSMMHFASCKVPLNLILRQGEPTKIVGQQFDAIEPTNAERVGGLQLVITNTGRTLKTGSPDKKEGTHGLGSKNKKIVSSNPINASEIQETLQDKVIQEQKKANLNLTLEMNEDERKRQRVQRLKQMNLVQTFDPKSYQDPSSSDWQKQQELNQIALIRNQTKAALLASVSKQAKLASNITINVISGFAHLFEIETNNPYQKSGKFKVQIEDEDQGMNEMTLVDNSKGEWEQWYGQGLCEKPKDWKVVKNGSMELESGQQCKLLFKFQSFREPVFDYGIGKKEEVDQINELKPRQIRIEILSSDGSIAQQIMINIQPKEMICDQIFRFYEAQGTKTISQIPNFILNQGSSDHKPLHLCKILCSNKSIKIQTTGDQSLYAEVENGPSMTSKNAFIFIYQDEFMSKMLGTCKIEIQSCTYLKLQVKAGEEYDHTLKCLNPFSPDKGPSARTVELFSSDPQLVYGPGGRHRNLFLLQPIRQMPQAIPICIKSRICGVQKARVSCVDINTRELIEMYLVEIDAEKPQIGKVVQVLCDVGQETFYKLDFKNPMSKNLMSFTFTSSSPEVMQPKQELIKFQPGEVKELCLVISPQSKADDKEVMVHINSQNEEGDATTPSHQETILFKVQVGKK